MGAIKPRKSDNVKNRTYRDESDKINGTFWDRNFEGPKSTVNGFIGAEDCAEGSGVHSIGKKNGYLRHFYRLALKIEKNGIRLVRN